MDENNSIQIIAEIDSNSNIENEPVPEPKPVDSIQLKVERYNANLKAYMASLGDTGGSQPFDFLFSTQNKKRKISEDESMKLSESDFKFYFLQSSTSESNYRKRLRTYLPDPKRRKMSQEDDIPLTQTEEVKIFVEQEAEKKKKKAELKLAMFVDLLEQIKKFDIEKLEEMMNFSDHDFANILSNVKKLGFEEIIIPLLEASSGTLKNSEQLKSLRKLSHVARISLLPLVIADKIPIKKMLSALDIVKKADNKVFIKDILLPLFKKDILIKKPFLLNFNLLPFITECLAWLEEGEETVGVNQLGILVMFLEKESSLEEIGPSFVRLIERSFTIKYTDKKFLIFFQLFAKKFSSCLSDGEILRLQRVNSCRDTILTSSIQNIFQERLPTSVNLE